MIDTSIEAFRAEVRNLGTAINPDVIGASMALYARQLPALPEANCNVVRDIAYGPDERHRLDIYTAAQDRAAGRPVLVYVHGGGFIGGDKALSGTPFYANVGAWAAEQGFVGVTMTYRLAPAHPWPAGREDVAAAVAWLRANIAAHGGSPDRIFLIGQSAGAAHVAGYVAAEDPARSAVAGGIMLSGLYDVPSLAKGPLELQYFGSDDSMSERQSSLNGLVASQVPMLFTVAEHDPPPFQNQAALLVQRWFAAKGAMPRLLCLPDANHMTAALSIGGGADLALGREIAAFVARFSRRELSYGQDN